VKKLLKFLMLLVYVFVASNLKLDAANGEERFKQDLRDDCAICYRSFYNKDGDKNLIDAEGQVIPVNPEEQLVSEGDSARLVPFEGLEIITLPCGHMFHNTDDCFKGHLTSRRTNANICPICRAQHEIPIPQPLAQPQREEIQNSSINSIHGNQIDYQILTTDGFSEVKRYLQRYSEFVKLKLILTNATRQIPEDFFVGLERLKLLDLEHNQLTSLPRSIENLTSLERLNLDRNQLASLPERIGQLTSLEKLDIRDNQLRSLPAEIGQLTSLIQLDIRDNQLTSLPDSIGNLTSLEILTLGSNQLTSLPESMGNLSSLRELDLYHNQLTSLPPEIGQLTSLKDLNLHGNQLTSFPTEIVSLRELRVLDLSHNRLAELPDLIGNITSLRVLKLSNNQLTELPRSICELKNLRHLALYYNQLTELPPEIGNLTNLEGLYLGNNHLIPWPRRKLQPLLDKRPRALILGDNSQIPASFIQRILNLFRRR